MGDPGDERSAEVREFGVSFRRFLEWASAIELDERRQNPVTSLVRGHLAADADTHSVVSRVLPVFEHVNLQKALDAFVDVAGRQVTVQGLTMPPHYASVNLQQLIAGDGMPPLRLSAAPLVDLPDGPESTQACLALALLLVTDSAGDYVIFLSGPSEHDPQIVLEVAGLDVSAAQALFAELDGLRSALNVYRGHLLDVSLDQMGRVSLAFARADALDRQDVILPPGVLERIERHALGVARHRQALLDAGQHLKRGLLLYGPPGTGKTHTTRYLVGRMDGYTRLLLAGRALHAVGSVAELARQLEPAAIVLEDVDLVAEDRSFGPGSSPVLFELLDAMDGAAPDADLLFLLTTNRADLLEPALASRPGRVDVAVEIDLPDPVSRRRLFELYARNVRSVMTATELDAVVARTEGVTASFLKELLRRAVLESLDDDGSAGGPLTVTGTQVERALTDLLDSSQQVTRSLLGVGNDPESLPGGGSMGPVAPTPGRLPRRSMSKRYYGR